MERILENQIRLVESATPNDVECSTVESQRIQKACLEEGVSAESIDEIQAIQARVLEIDSLTDELQHKMQASSAEILNVQSRLSKLSSSFRSVEDEKKVLREKFTDEKKTLEEQLRNADKLSADPSSHGYKVPYMRVEQIDVDIKKLTSLLIRTSLSLEETNKLEQEVNFLQSFKDFLKIRNDGLKQILRDIAEKDVILNDLLERQEEQSKILAQIEEKNFYQQLEFQTRIMERNAAKKKIKALNEQVEKYCELEGRKKEEEIVQRRKHEQTRDTGPKEQENIQNQRELDNSTVPYTNEIIAADQLTSYLNRVASWMEDAASLAPQEVVQEIVAPTGVGNLLLSKKKKFHEDNWFSGTSKGRKGRESKAPKSKRKEKFPLSLDALIFFERVKLSPPATVGDVAKTIQDLQLRRDEFLKLQIEAKSMSRKAGKEELTPKEEFAQVGGSPTAGVESGNI